MRLIPVAACGALFAVSLVGQAEEISASGEHADWPSAAFAPNGDLWVAWSAYDDSGPDQIRARRRIGQRWEEIVTVSPRAGDYLQTAIAVQPDGRVSIA